MKIDLSNLSIGIIGLIGFILLPIGLIWSVNTLLNLNIEYNFYTWISVVVLHIYLQLIIKAGTIHFTDKK